MRLPKIILGVLLTLASLAGAGPARADDGLFGSREIPARNISQFTNWTGVMGRFKVAEAVGEGLCATAAGGQRAMSGEACPWEEWRALVGRLAGRDALTQLREVNAAFNARKYVVDRVNWGMEDYWETVFEFMARNGDCEDYAIAKYVTLRALGWPASQLRLVIVRDTKLDLNHAILAAYTGEGVYIGDNQVKGLVKASAIRHYRPIYSINEQGWWLHRARKEGR